MSHQYAPKYFIFEVELVRPIIARRSLQHGEPRTTTFSFVAKFIALSTGSSKILVVGLAIDASANPDPNPMWYGQRTAAVGIG